MNGSQASFLAYTVKHVYVEAGAGDDTVSSGIAGPCTLFGGDGNDRLSGGPKTDWIDGGAGNDMLVASAGDDTLTGGDGTDTAEYRGATSDATDEISAGI